MGLSHITHAIITDQHCITRLIALFKLIPNSVTKHICWPCLVCVEFEMEKTEKLIKLCDIVSHLYT